MTPLSKHPTQKLLRDRVVAEARSWIGTPFLHQQSLKGVGVDCIGVILGVGRDLELLQISPDQWAPYAGYSRQPNPRVMRRFMCQFLKESPTPRTQIPPAGSIGWFGWRLDLPMHLGIVAEFEGRATVVHSFEPAGACCENSIDETWLRLVESWWDFPALEVS